MAIKTLLSPNSTDSSPPLGDVRKMSVDNHLCLRLMLDDTCARVWGASFTKM